MTTDMYGIVLHAGSGGFPRVRETDGMESCQSWFEWRFAHWILRRRIEAKLPIASEFTHA